MKAFQDIIQHFNPISLKDMEGVSLMNRTDTKYVFHTDFLDGILSRAHLMDYSLLGINNASLFNYKSQYFDTEELRFYFEHHNGTRPRHKLRFREYSNTGEVFLEIKRKTNRERTRKSRIRVEGMESSLSLPSMQYIQELIPGLHKPPVVSIMVSFNRMTLVSAAKNERITIDTDIGFSLGNLHTKIPPMVICEVKRDSFAGRSHYMKLLKDHRIYPCNISKYCMGTILLRKDIKTNRFKRYRLELNRLQNESTPYTPASF